ncbi:hypothetical protein BB559_004879 [Furculomyces boomerangus]|uniref:Uncharacterized protein n=2 Tax=Harpellales TaxID=61421 RepID=A0A2T9YC36_9FUNG|nr:hypothetical protein BB559_004879 [Furculomyces boomerangus]PVZ99948.1 hypothetical protein BB558_004015 [Smittium angustum]
MLIPPLFFMLSILHPILAVDQYKPNIYQKDDLIALECTILDANQNEIKDMNGNTIYQSLPKCMETNMPLSLKYGSDNLLQCSIGEESGFYRQLQSLVLINKPLHCRVPTSKDKNPEYLPVFISLQKVDIEEDHIKVSGNLNAVFHGQSGYIVSGSIYSILNRPTPTALNGVSTFHLYQRWFEGFSPSLPMSSSPEFAKNTISPVAAMLMCLLTATVCYTLGRLYVENWLLPSIVLQYKSQPKPLSKPKRNISPNRKKEK